MARAELPEEVPERRAAQLVREAEQRGLTRGRADAAAVALSHSAAAIALRSMAEACAAMAIALAQVSPDAKSVLSECAQRLRESAVKLAGSE